MLKDKLSSIDSPQFAGGKNPLTTTPIVGSPHREYSEMFIPGKEILEEGEMRVTVLGSGNPWVTRAQAAGSILVEIGNKERDLLIFDLGSGSLANFSTLKLPVNKLDKVFFTHLHADHTADLITLFGSYRKSGRVGPVNVWGPSGSDKSLGTERFVECIVEACAWDTEASRGFHSNESFQMPVTEFNFRHSQVVYEKNEVKVTSFPVIHAIEGAVGYKIEFNGLTFVFSGDTRPTKTLVEACTDHVNLLIHECFPPPEVLATIMNMPIERATTIINLAHTTPATAGKVFELVKPDMAGLWHTVLTPKNIPAIFKSLREEYDGPVVQTQDLTVFNLTKGAVIVRQALVEPQSNAIPGKSSIKPSIGKRPVDPEWWDDALI